MHFYSCVVLTRFSRIVENIPEGKKRKRKFIMFSKSVFENLTLFVVLTRKIARGFKEIFRKAETETDLLALHIVFHGDLSLRNRSEAVGRYRYH